LKVQRVEEDGRVSDLGTIHAGATQEQIVARHKKPGTYQVIPIDTLNEELSKPHRFEIAADHAYFLRGGGPEAIPTTMGMDPALLAMFERIMDQQNAKMELLEKRMEEERKELSAQRVESAKVQGAQQVQMIDHLIGMQKSAQQADAERYQQMQKEMLAIQVRDREQREDAFKQQMAAQSKLHETLTEQMRHMAEMTIKTFESQSELRREEMERREKREADERKEKAKLDVEYRKEQEAIRAERERERQAHWERTERQNKEHMETQLGLFTRQIEMQGSGGLAALGEQIESVKALGDLLNPKEEGGITSLLGKAIDGYNQTKVEEAKAKAQAMREMAEAEWEAEDEPPMVAMPQVTGPAGGPPQLLASEGAPEPAINVRGSGMYDSYAPQEGAMGPPGGAPQMAPHAAPMVSPGTGLPLETLRTARRAIRGIVDLLKVSEPRDWESIIVGSLTNEPRIIDYLRTTTVTKACAEGGAPPEMTRAIVAAIGRYGFEGIQL